MRINKFLSTTLLALLGVSAIASVASALPMKKDAKGAIVIGGLTANTAYSIQYPNVPLVTKATTDACGWVKVKLPPGATRDNVPTFYAGGTTYNNTLFEEPMYNSGPVCASGVQTNPDIGANTGLVKTAADTYIKKTAATPVEFTFPGFGKTRKFTANDCAFIKISPSTAWPTPTSGTLVLKDLGLNEFATVNLSSIATGPVPKCSDSVIYTPPGWY